MATEDRGLGSPNMPEDKKHEIQSKGGQASHGGGRKSEHSTEEDANKKRDDRENQNLGEEDEDMDRM